MSESRDRPVSVVDAARLIYGTPAPTEHQIRRVYERMRAGALRVDGEGRPPSQWTTTEQALADYLATEMLKRGTSPPAGKKGPRRPLASADGVAPAITNTKTTTRRLRKVYHGIWRDYFLAVMLRRRMAHRSLAFHRAVIAGQIATLFALVMLSCGLSRLAFEPEIPERIAIERWIDENSEKHRITRWHPTQVATGGEGVIVEVEYHYVNDSRRTIHTRRSFRVVGDQVNEIVDD